MASAGTPLDGMSEAGAKRQGEDRLQSIRRRLKAWEALFREENGGRRPTAQDIDARPEIGALPRHETPAVADHSLWWRVTARLLSLAHPLTAIPRRGSLQELPPGQGEQVSAARNGCCHDVACATNRPPSLITARTRRPNAPYGSLWQAFEQEQTRDFLACPACWRPQRIGGRWRGRQGFQWRRGRP